MEELDHLSKITLSTSNTSRTEYFVHISFGLFYAFGRWWRILCCLQNHWDVFGRRCLTLYNKFTCEWLSSVFIWYLFKRRWSSFMVFVSICVWNDAPNSTRLIDLSLIVHTREYSQEVYICFCIETIQSSSE